MEETLVLTRKKHYVYGIRYVRNATKDISGYKEEPVKYYLDLPHAKNAITDELEKRALVDPWKYDYIIGKELKEAHIAAYLWIVNRDTGGIEYEFEILERVLEGYSVLIDSILKLYDAGKINSIAIDDPDQKIGRSSYCSEIKVIRSKDMVSNRAKSSRKDGMKNEDGMLDD